MQFTSFAVLACAAVATAMPASSPATKSSGATSKTAVANGSGNGNDSSKVCDAANNGKVSCCNDDNASGGLLGVNGLLGGSCEVAINVLNCQNTQTQACCPTSNQTGLIPIGSICVPISL